MTQHLAVTQGLPKNKISKNNNNHHSRREDVLYLEIGDRTPQDEGSYPNDDLMGNKREWFVDKSPQRRHTVLILLEPVG